jgi:hypothetical protein
MYACVSAQQFVGVVLVVIARLSVVPLCSVQGTAAVPCGIMNTAGNKGGVTCSVSVLDTRVAFVAVHLAGTATPPPPPRTPQCCHSRIQAGQNHVDRRTADIVTIFEGTRDILAAGRVAAAAAAAAASAASPDHTRYAEITNTSSEQSEGADASAGGSGSIDDIMAHDITFVLGDLNYRLEGDKADLQALVAASDWASLQSRDQVIACKTQLAVFCLLTYRSSCSKCR